MKRDPLVYGVIGVLLGGIIVWFMATSVVNNNMTGMMQMMGMRFTNQEQSSMMNKQNEGENFQNMMGMNSSMDDMMGSMRGKTGDEFDRAFISSMIIHHQGAIDMAKEAKISAKHDEIKKLAEDIISAQMREIDQMKMWQNAWEY